MLHFTDGNDVLIFLENVINIFKCKTLNFFQKFEYLWQSSNLTKLQMDTTFTYEKLKLQHLIGTVY